MTEPPQMRQRGGHRLLVAHPRKPHVHPEVATLHAAGMRGKSGWAYMDGRRREPRRLQGDRR